MICAHAYSPPYPWPNSERFMAALCLFCGELVVHEIGTPQPPPHYGWKSAGFIHHDTPPLCLIPAKGRLEA